MSTPIFFVHMFLQLAVNVSYEQEKIESNSRLMTENDWSRLLRANQPQFIDPRSDLIVYLNDFHPYDRADLKKEATDFLNANGMTSVSEETAEEDESEDDFDIPDKDDENEAEDSGENDGENDHEVEKNNVFLVRAFGLYQGASISIDICDFLPYFYVKIPESFYHHSVSTFIEYIKSKVYYKNRSGLVSGRICLGKPFSHFTGDDKFKYVKLVFKTYEAFKSYSYVFKKPHKIPALNMRNAFKFELFESNISPLVRLLHAKDIKPSGWIKLPGGTYRVDPKFIRLNPYSGGSTHPVWVNKAPKYSNSGSLCQLHVEIDWEHLVSLPDKIDIPPIVCAAFDIEADSSHGDFPIAVKTYQKLARELIQAYKKHQDSPDLRKRLAVWMALAFDDYYRNDDMKPVALDRMGIDQAKLDAQIASIVPQVLHLIQNRSDSSDMDTLSPAGFVDQFDSVDQFSPVDQFDQTSPVDQFDQFDSIDQFSPLHQLLEYSLPELDLAAWSTNYWDYATLAKAIYQQYHLRIKQNSQPVLTDPIRVLSGWLKIVFNPYYDGEDINHIYLETLGGNAPQKITASFLEKLVPKVLDFCRQGAEDLLDQYLSQYLPRVAGDPLIQIGTTFKYNGASDCFLKHIITLGSANTISNAELIADEHKDIKLPYKVLLAETRREVSEILMPVFKKTHLMATPKDIITDIVNQVEIPKESIETVNASILQQRCRRQISTDHAQVVVESYQTEAEVLMAWSRLIRQSDPDLIVGYNIFGFDFKYMFERAQYLAQVMHNDAILTDFAQLGRFAHYYQKLKEQKLSSNGLGDNVLYYIEMYGRVSCDLFKIVQANYKLPSYKLDAVCQEFMHMSKNDLPPKELFILQKGSAADRTYIARYCLVDCILCNRLLDKLEILTNNIGMSNVCSVPLSYLFLRGQGIKILSLVAKETAKNGYLLPVLAPVTAAEAEKFEGACVLPAKTGIILTPVSVVDFASLYPREIIASNLSHDSYVEAGSKWDKLPQYQYYDVEYDVIEERTVPGRKKKIRVVTGKQISRYVQLPNGQKSLLPRILKMLLDARAETRERQKSCAKGSFEWNILEGLQLAYKVTANSLYGQTGANTSPIRKKAIAASTTAGGRKLIHFTSKFYRENYRGCVTIYGDTDSCFVSFETRDFYGNLLEGLDSVYRSMELAMEGAQRITQLISQPHDLTFEKVIYPFMLFSKKRYTGLYFTDPFECNCSQKSMGIVLKRRDNARIVKRIYGRVIQLILYEQNIAKAFEECRIMLEEVLQGKYPLEEFLITKSLRGWYKMPERIAHKVLADRIGRRDPGNKPQSNDRLEYAYVKIPESTSNKVKILQGDRIETPMFIRDHKLSLDYKIYITNQLMKPILQVFEMTEYDGNRMISKILMDYDNRNKGLRKITEFFKTEAAPQYKKISQFANVNTTTELVESESEDELEEDSDSETGEMLGDLADCWNT